MWEMVEMLVYYFKHKKWPLPLFLVIILIGIVFGLSIYSARTIPEKAIVVQVSPTESVTPIYTEGPLPIETPVKQVDETRHVREGIRRHKKEEAPQPEASPVGSNITHAKDAVTDALKIEGINREVSDKIFHQLREQIKKPEDEAMPLAVIVRQVLGPDVSDEEVFRITDIMSQALKDSFDYVQSR